MINGHVHPAFADLVRRFERMYDQPEQGGGALAVYLHGEPVVDVWSGWRDPHHALPWQEDTVAMSFSTTKGIAAALVHRLADQGLLDVNQPVATYWPAFGAAGKDRMTVAQMLAHSGGLHGVRDIVDHAEDMLDHRGMAERLAAATPSPKPGDECGYHGLTFGWLVSGLVESLTGEDVRDVLAREVAEPLGITDGLWFGAPESQRDRLARLIPDLSRTTDWAERVIEGINRRWPGSRHAEAFLVPGISSVIFSDRVHDTAFPAVNGAFTARALARVYGALANGGSVNGHRLMSAETIRAAGRVQRRDRDYILRIPMRWRMGWHQAFIVGRFPRLGFGHFGFGGSGAWADPETGMSIAFVTNRLGSASTPLGDTRLPRLGRVALALARRA